MPIAQRFQRWEKWTTEQVPEGRLTFSRTHAVSAGIAGAGKTFSAACKAV
jgi:hypothetical protein